MSVHKPNVSFDKAYALALEVFKTCKQLRKDGENILSKQLLRSGTSIGANLAEAHASISDADLAAKISIAYKECHETRYWLSLLRDSKELSATRATELIAKTDDICRILFASMRTLRRRRDATSLNE